MKLPCKKLDGYFAQKKARNHKFKSKTLKFRKFNFIQNIKNDF